MLLWLLWWKSIHDVISSESLDGGDLLVLNGPNEMLTQDEVGFLFSVSYWSFLLSGDVGSFAFESLWNCSWPLSSFLLDAGLGSFSSLLRSRIFCNEERVSILPLVKGENRSIKPISTISVRSMLFWWDSFYPSLCAYTMYFLFLSFSSLLFLFLPSHMRALVGWDC